MVPGGVREQRTLLPLPSGGDAAGCSQPCSGWSGSTGFSDRWSVMLLVFSGMLQFMHFSTSDSGEILETDNLHAPKYQWNTKWTGSGCIFVLTPGHYRNPGEGKKEESFGAGRWD